jgi:hypothetical protein
LQQLQLVLIKKKNLKVKLSAILVRSQQCNNFFQLA